MNEPPLVELWCGHWAGRDYAQLAHSPDGDPILICPDCATALPEQQEAKTIMPIQNVYQNGEWVRVEAPAEIEHHCALPIRGKLKAVSGDRWQCPTCQRNYTLNRQPGAADSWINA
jgi:hypothetical protein